MQVLQHLFSPNQQLTSAATEGLDAGTQVWEHDNLYGSAVSKSFYCPQCDRVSNTLVKIPKFRLVRREGREEQHAEFLAVVSLGEFTFSVWRRYSDFAHLAASLAQASA